MNSNIQNIINEDSILFFDMDGTLIDTDMANFLSYKKAIETIKESDCNITFDKNRRLNRNLLQTIIPSLSLKEYDDIVFEKERNYKDFLPETQPILQTLNILATYSNRNITVLVTNCRKDRANLILDYHNLINKFSNIFYRIESTYKINKYSNAISLLGIEPHSIIVFENEKTEIEDAISAGIDPSNIKIILN
ncbi:MULTISPECIES: HAD hydrolase-like protein [unclassified Sphingobacterium]|uniref:HAD hydrolase-like protein n=1 Tax=unclassified Sphingobacterium TaxID=2609468 RepID=UPI001042916A|nr:MULTISPECIES: HAD hydrolase-like protein [unclassified Sphingobacterium]MCS3552329.1 beta-phosphoglucomutase-like phosphatase (HAD superfamily) [Sphingobacterium sp. JUb21]TCR10905.1 beta-phosphoglucomutase-like phosphatase (HAD superfamily) [Sphingobacterium sp. JUb20]